MTRKLIADRMATLGTENAFKIGMDIRRCEEAGKNVIKLNLGEPDFNSADAINRVAKQEIDNGNSHYCDPAGLLPFRKVIAEQLGRTRGIKTDPERVVVTTGGKPPISYTMMTYVNPGDEVVYPSPGYPIYESWVTFTGAVAKPIHLKEEKGFRFTADEIEALVSDKTKVIIINSPSNPTGGVLTKQDLNDISDVIKSRCPEDVRVYSDEVYEEILFDGSKHYSIASVDGMAQRTILVSGHSKTYAMTGWRLGYALLPTREEAEIFKHLNINIISCTPPFIQMAGMEALTSPELPPIIKKMGEAFEDRRNVVVKMLNDIDGVTCAMPRGAFYVFPNIGPVCERLGIIDDYEKLDEKHRNEQCPSAMFQMFLLYEHGVATMDRNSFGSIGAEGQHFLRLSTATDMDSLKEGVRRLEAASGDKDGWKKFFESGILFQ